MPDHVVHYVYTKPTGLRGPSPVVEGEQPKNAQPVLCVAEADPRLNGIYDTLGPAAPANQPWVRTSSFGENVLGDGVRYVTAGEDIWVLSGSSNKRSLWYVDSEAPQRRVGLDPLVFGRYPMSLRAGDGVEIAPDGSIRLPRQAGVEPGLYRRAAPRINVLGVIEYLESEEIDPAFIEGLSVSRNEDDPRFVEIEAGRCAAPGEERPIVLSTPRSFRLPFVPSATGATSFWHLYATADPAGADAAVTAIRDGTGEYPAVYKGSAKHRLTDDAARWLATVVTDGEGKLLGLPTDNYDATLGSRGLVRTTTVDYLLRNEGRGAVTVPVLRAYLELEHSPGEWVYPALQNGWVNNSATAGEGVAYRRLPPGRAEVVGIVKSGTLNAPMFTLPAGLRPAGRRAFPVLCGGPATFGVVEVMANGAVYQLVGPNGYVYVNFAFDVVAS